MRRNGAHFGKLIRDKQRAVADLQFPMHYLAAVRRGVAADFFGAERLLVKVNCLGGAVDENCWRQGVKATRNRLHFGHVFNLLHWLDSSAAGYSDSRLSKRATRRASKAE